MIPILASKYPYIGNGLGGLSDTIECIVTHEVNGIYELELRYPITGAHYSEISVDYFIMAEPDNITSAQPFRIYRITKPLNGVVTIYARHISYDMAGIIVEPFTAASLTDAMTVIPTKCTPTSPFTISTTKTVASLITINAPRPLWRLLGGQEGSLLDVYGGEWDFDGLNATLKSEIGTDRGVSIRYGKNMTEMEQDATLESTYSAVYPYWFNEESNTLVTLTEKTISITGSVVTDKVMILDLSGDFQDAPTQTQLRDRANAYIAANSVGNARMSWRVSFQSEDGILEQVMLGDTVKVVYETLGVDATARAVKTEYDVLQEHYRAVTIGRVKQNLAAIIVGNNEEVNNKIDKTKSTLEQAIDDATDSIRNGGGSFRLIYDGDNVKEIVSLDNPDISQAQNVWRWNNGGFGFSANGYNGTYALAMTPDGQIVADRITTGTLSANRVRAGLLTDEANKNSWNLDTGALTITDGTINIQTSSESFDAITLYYGSKSVQLNPTTLLYKNSTESASVDATGFYINKLSGTSLSSLQKAGLILKEESGNNVIKRGAFGSSGYIYQYDENEKQRTLLGVGIDGYGLYFYNTSGIHLVQFSANGLWLNDDQGDNRFEINRTGEAVVRIRNGSGVARMELNNESLIFMDGASVQRGMYSYNGITLSNSSGTATAQYPNGVDFSSGISAYNNRATITSSDCRKWGNFRFVNIVITSAHSATNSPRMITLGSENAPTHEHALSCVDITGGSGSVGVSVPCKVNTSGNIFMKETTSGNIYAITGFYYM